MNRRPLTQQRSAWQPCGDGCHVRRVADGLLQALAAHEPLGPAGTYRWHLSISHVTNHLPPRPGRYPTWDEIAHARYELLPAELTFALLLPPADEYVAVHPTTFHLHEIRPHEE